ncbi:MAG: DUF4193 family protein [Acidimicrobiia bacterium]
MADDELDIDSPDLEVDDDVEVFDDDADGDELEAEIDEVLTDEVDEVLVIPDTTADDEDEETEGDEALDELEAEELELIDDEVSESLLVDEVAELRAIRREELTMNVEAQAVRSGEFVCQSCFLVKRTTQLANRKKMICTDCAS